MTGDYMFSPFCRISDSKIDCVRGTLKPVFHSSLLQGAQLEASTAGSRGSTQSRPAVEEYEPETKRME